jgi:hypothetical protein
VAYLTRLTYSTRFVPYFRDPLSPRSTSMVKFFDWSKRGGAVRGSKPFVYTLECSWTEVVKKL